MAFSDPIPNLTFETHSSTSESLRQTVFPREVSQIDESPVLDHQNKGMSKEATIANRPCLSSASRKNKGWMATTFGSKRGALGERSAVHTVRNRKRIPLVVGIL